MPNQKVKELLADLGRATLRGVRRCPKCGTYNGTRGLSCKNKSCDVIFKEAGEKRKLSTEASKLITESSQQVFSVRVRDKGPDYRSFVRLPQTSSAGNGEEGQEVGGEDDQSRARCYVETCQRYVALAENFIRQESCQHIQAAQRCFADAHPLTIKHSVLNALEIPGEMKQAIWLLATETGGPLVQRVSKHIMVVKCKPSPSHPLGFLHFSFFTTRVRESVQHKFFCGCRYFKSPSKGQQPNGGGEEVGGSHKRCIHFYACVCAFACDEKLAVEFAHYVHLDQVFPHFSPTLASSTTRQLLAILKETQGNGGDGVGVEGRVEGGCVGESDVGESGGLVGGSEGVEVEVDSSFLDAADIAIAEDVQVHDLDHIQVQIHTVDGEAITFAPVSDSEPDAEILEVVGVKRRREEDALPLALQQSSGNARLAPSSSSGPLVAPAPPVKKTGVKKGPPVSLKKEELSSDQDRGWSFEEWLGTVTERVNRSMHYELDGHLPAPLTFLAPQRFFNQLRERISCGSKKRRLPNHIAAGQPCASLPQRKGNAFIKYSWKLTNVLQLKRVFDTPKVPLEVTRSFLQNRDGSYELYRPPVMPSHSSTTFAQSSHPPIKPLELKTFLKVGTTSLTQKEPTPFVIEWIPDVLPDSHVGELRLTFQFGHQRNGHLEVRIPSSSSSVAASHAETVAASSSLTAALNEDNSVTTILLS